ncbi:MAG TPA: hypothetical protein VN259_09855 [Xanthomonadales bacterium]|nr:hypothetical protein [Xanthomonadales bacterium]
MNLNGWISWQVSLVCAGCLLLGAGAAFVATSQYLQSDMAVLAASLKRKSERVRLLESLVLQQSQSTVAQALDRAPPVAASTEAAPPLPDAPEPAASSASRAHEPAPSESPVVTPSAAAASSVRRGESATPPRRAEPQRSLPPAPSTSSNPPPSATNAGTNRSPPAQPPNQAILAEDQATEVGAAPTQAEIAAVIKGGRIEGVSADKAGVERLGPTSVHLRGGRVIKVGALFPSGERLLAVDPENGRVITNQRQILMFF